MYIKTLSIIVFVSLLGFSQLTSARKNEVSPIVITQAKIAKAYEQGWAKSSPVDMDFIEKKLIEAENFYKKRKKKKSAPLLEQIDADLKIVEMRHKVNLLNAELTEVKNKNLLDRKTLAELKEQLK